MKRCLRNSGQSLLESLLLTGLVATIVIIAMTTPDGVLEQVQNALKDYYNRAVEALVGQDNPFTPSPLNAKMKAGPLKAIGDGNPQPVDGGWCAPGVCVNGVQELVCACPRPAFGGANCQGAPFQPCGGTQPTPPPGSGKIYQMGPSGDPMDYSWVCPPGTTEQGGVCTFCAPDCVGKNCGDDGCGGECGTCDADSGESCVSNVCQLCEPNCIGRVCGPDPVCGQDCGPLCAPGFSCNTDGQCVTGCIPDCGTRMCGSDGCGGECGVNKCSPGQYCLAGECVDDCVPYCAGTCGSDGCGGTCECPSNEVCCSTGANGCSIGSCVDRDFCCPPDRSCGPDLCGEGTCGTGCDDTTEVCFGAGGTGPTTCYGGSDECQADTDPDPYDYETTESRPVYGCAETQVECCPGLFVTFYSCDQTGTEYVRRTCPSETHEGGDITNPCQAGMSCMSDCNGSCPVSSCPVCS